MASSKNSCPYDIDEIINHVVNNPKLLAGLDLVINEVSSLDTPKELVRSLLESTTSRLRMLRSHRFMGATWWNPSVMSFMVHEGSWGHNLDNAYESTTNTNKLATNSKKLMMSMPISARTFMTPKYFYEGAYKVNDFWEGVSDFSWHLGDAY